MESQDDVADGGTRKSARANKGKPPRRFGDAVASTQKREKDQDCENVGSDGDSTQSNTTVIPSTTATKNETQEDKMEDQASTLRKHGIFQTQYGASTFPFGELGSRASSNSHLTTAFAAPGYYPNISKFSLQMKQPSSEKSVPSCYSSTKVRKLELERQKVVAIQELELRKRQVEQARTPTTNAPHSKSQRAVSVASSQSEKFERFMSTIAGAIQSSSENAQASAQNNADILKTNSDAIKALLSRQGGSKELPIYSGDPT
ncbi:unnamed protein product, partial [Allacma fusca]